MDKQTKYEHLLTKIHSVLGDERDSTAWMSTLSCLLKQDLDFFWVGFYRLLNGELVIGSYQGTLGCLHISLNRGVCGACATQKKTIIVPDVHQFAGHIACDHRSKSEIAVPVFDVQDHLRAVLDIDSDHYAAFDATDQKYLEQITARMRNLEWTKSN